MTAEGWGAVLVEEVVDGEVAGWELCAMLPPDIAAIVRRIIVAVSAGDYAAALAEVSATRCSEADIFRAVSEYGRRFSAPPFVDWDVVPILTGGAGGWSISAPLWSKEEGGRSDLHLFLTASLSPSGGMKVVFDDIHVP